MLRVAILAALVLAPLCACSKPDQDQPAKAGIKLEAGSPKAVSPPVQPSSALLAVLQTNFERATRWGPASQRRLTRMPESGNAGLVCTPGHLDRNKPIFRLILPQRVEEREGTLAIIVPDGSLRFVYVSDVGDAIQRDLISQSNTIEWDSAKRSDTFSVDTRSFQAMESEEGTPKPVFREAGIYQIALVNSLDGELLAANRTPFQLLAGCVVHWQPQI
jgi:hypothetical protein